MRDSLPGFADTVVIGAGTAGAAVAGELVAGSEQSVLLLEAGPDYGAFADGRWPADLTDARALPTSHDWGIYQRRPIGSARYQIRSRAGHGRMLIAQWMRRDLGKPPRL